MAALTGLVSHPGIKLSPESYSGDKFAEDCYILADAMMDAREKK
jgi:hypothetical protein